MAYVDVYETVTNNIIVQLEAGRLPWVQPWDNSQDSGLPINAISKNTYSGINVLLLWGAAIEGEYVSQVWLTYKQAVKLGGSVKKGSKGTSIVYANSFTPTGEKKAAKDENRTARQIPFLKRYSVFNIAQCDDLPEELFAKPEPSPEREQHEAAESLIKATQADFRIGGDRAYYNPTQDFIQVPPQPSFKEQLNYYRTCFHELGHWTGAKSRLARTFGKSKGDHDYAKEELVAELTAAYVCATMGIKPTVRHADYIASWLECLKADKKAIFVAASKASKAATYILELSDS